MNEERYRLFKYRPINRFTLESLSDSTLFGARPEQLNDPQDCQIDLVSTIRQAAHMSSGSKRLALEDFLHDKGGSLASWQMKARNVGVCSCSMIGPAQLESLPLWEKYAGECSGVCLLYEFNEEFIVNPANGFLAIDKVRYGDDYLVDWLINDSPNPANGEFVIELLKRFLTTKTKRWSYEVEGRILRLQSGRFVMPPESLIQVCFGDRAKPEDIQKVQEVVKQHSSTCSIYRLTQEPNGSESIMIKL